ncbi:MAG: OmpH family outer membrane protein [Flammeovirgaceae bacterium]
MKDGIKVMIGMLLGGTLLFGLSLFMQPKQGYVNKEKLFSEFKGKQELELKLSSMQQRHKYVLDSLGMELTTLQQQGNDNELFLKKRDFYLQVKEEFAIDESQKSAAYTKQIWEQIAQYMNDYGKQHGYEFIFGAHQDSDLMYAKEESDITAEVIQYINGKYEGN